MAIIGGAIFTPLMGLIYEHSGSMARAMLLPLAAYLFVAYFALFGSRVRGQLVSATVP
jgi:FHS family L-fucose permease-like MFS transporter